jgi:ABC-2 type transport system permease protein
VTALLKAEIRKLTTTRSALWLLVGSQILTIAAATTMSGQEAAELRRPFTEHQFFFLQTYVKLFVVVLGIRIVTDEFRFGTIVPTIVTARNRLRVLAAKTIIATGIGLVVGVLTQAVLFGTVKVFLASKGVELVLGDRGVPAIAGSVIAIPIWALMGVAVGAVFRSQVAAVVTATVWLLGIEDVIRTPLGDVGGYLPGQAGYSLALSPTDRVAVIGGLALLGWTAAMWISGAVITQTRDI